MIKVVAKLTQKPGMYKELRGVASKLVAETRRESGCLAFQLFKDENQDVFYFIEEWRNEESLQKHVNSEHYQKAMAGFKEVLEKEPEISVCNLMI